MRPPEATDSTAAEDVVLAYRIRRSSGWRRRDGGPWRTVFHQGTPQPQD